LGTTLGNIIGNIREQTRNMMKTQELKKAYPLTPPPPLFQGIKDELFWVYV